MHSNEKVLRMQIFGKVWMRRNREGRSWSWVSERRTTFELNLGILKKYRRSRGGILRDEQDIEAMPIRVNSWIYPSARL
jgi:hypothetical protein